MQGVTLDMASQLQAILRGESFSAQADNPAEQYHPGAVWFGDWFHRRVPVRFGSPEKPNHNAAISRRDRQKQRFTLAPITSIPRSYCAIMLPRGTIPATGKFVPSYLLPRIKLRASRQALENHFEYRCQLAPDMIQQMTQMMNARPKTK